MYPASFHVSTSSANKCSVALHINTALMVQLICFPLTLHPINQFCYNKVTLSNTVESTECASFFTFILTGLLLWS